ncbi:MAG: signal peptidase I [Geobacteraceae bacterium]|nr:signal peptidase I [Geobacteraceae bacterium]
MKKSTRLFVTAAFIAIILGFAVRACVLKPYVTPSFSMEDTIAPGDRFLVNTMIFGARLPFTDIIMLELRAPQRGDVIVFQYPQDPRKELVSRIIGLPGDVVQGAEKKVYVNGRLYAHPSETHKETDLVPKEQNPRDTFKPVTVPAGSYFVMGDNRDRSYDSRFWGCLPRKNIRGLFMVRYWPIP